MSCVLILRKTEPDVPRPYRVPTIVPIFTVSVAIFLALMPIISAPSIKYLFALGFIALGVIVYIPFVYLKRRPQWMGKKSMNVFSMNNHKYVRIFSDKITFLLQVLFEAAPTQYTAVPTKDS